MTISIRQILDPSARNHAGALLELAPNADPDECRRAALAQIDAADYDPTAAWHAAAEILFSLPSELKDAPHAAATLKLREEIETQLHDQVEEFAATMFQLEPAARLRRWNELRMAAGFSRPLHRRLELLSPGLDLCPAANDTLGADRRGQLIRWILTLFPLRPAARSVSYLQALDALRETPPEWESAAEKLEKTQPGLTRLAPDLISAARSYKLQRQALERQTKRRRREARKESWARWRASTSASPIWILLLVVGLGARFIGALSKMESPTSNNRPSLSAKDIQSAQEFFERMQRQQEALDRQSKGITPADLQRESVSLPGFDSPEFKDGTRTYRLIQELRKSQGKDGAIEFIAVAAMVLKSLDESERYDLAGRLREHRELTDKQIDAVERYLVDIGILRASQMTSRSDTDAGLNKTEESVPDSTSVPPVHDEPGPEETEPRNDGTDP